MFSGLNRQWNISGDEVTYVYIAGSVILEKKLEIHVSPNLLRLGEGGT